MNKEIIKEFLSVFPYEIMHEENILNTNEEIFFCAIQKSHIKNNTVIEFFNKINNEFPLSKLSKSSQNYLADIKEDFLFIFVDSINKKSSTYEHNKKFIINNANNILSIKYFGEIADLDSHINSEFNKYLDNFKTIGSGVGVIVKNSFELGFDKSKQIFEENKPFVKDSTIKIKNNLLNQFKNLKKKF